jgi:hypothetical protein
MKLLLQSIDKSEIDQVRILLDSKGIPTFIGNENTARNIGFITPARSYQLWLFVDEQERDAELLIENEEHQVSSPVDVEEYYQHIEALRKDNLEYLFNKSMLALVIAGILIFGLYIYIKAV